MSQHRGFTLIELLIVVAIIAILAAIAVPNFLEAQVRAKVSRAKADMRSIATAVESYAVDWNMAPPGAEAMRTKACVSNTVKLPNQNDLMCAWCQSKLTTPVAYMTSIPHDPFLDRGAPTYTGNVSYVNWRVFAYQTFGACFGNNAWGKAYKKGYTWALRCVGPMRVENGTVPDTLIGTIPGANPYSTMVSYDPTNGTVSIGWILRSNKGEFTVPQ